MKIVPALLFFLLAPMVVLGQISAINPSRSDNLFAPGLGAAVVATADGVVFANVNDAEPVVDLAFPSPLELAGVRVHINGTACGVWFTASRTVWFVVPGDLPLLPRQPNQVLVVTSAFGQWATMIKVAHTAPGFILNQQGTLAGGWLLSPHLGPLPFDENYPVVISDGPSVLMLWGRGFVGRPAPMRNSDWPELLAFTPRVWIWIGNRRLQAECWPSSLPGLEIIFVPLPADLPAGEHLIRGESGRQWTPGEFYLTFIR